MPFLSWLISKILQFFMGSAHNRRADLIAREKEAGAFESRSSGKTRNFADDYNAAAMMLRERMDRKYPNGHYARLRSNENSPYDHGEDRAHAVDTMSTAIAMALRDGASVRQAAEAGAASVGI
ncbi:MULTISPECIES: hypothetical protein [Methylobacterium]|jgi:hypothetical protein|uniref:Uncharacterized protein n=1 Tax=Methylobacterium longum TaxID=767694 RepID=A0ABT8AY96_9HYPH|nr:MULTISPECIES: hypothetical protein [Methylobacterium]MCJ2103219.1 hypothetical protein [Methylobacterium sp. E-046]MDN3574572.1 hypothetical protein [Methylobacterium longum]GJE14836.1 hypothetical protein FOHLNKBM_5911 [Methylobacterium longum]